VCVAPCAVFSVVLFLFWVLRHAQVCAAPRAGLGCEG
ncbi:hypothetical protein A2U01_0117461, partial [Trifolium medium]|nr:hypothetical protein [Trifolium medium]